MTKLRHRSQTVLPRLSVLYNTIELSRRVDTCGTTLLRSQSVPPSLQGVASIPTHARDLPLPPERRTPSASGCRCEASKRISPRGTVPIDLPLARAFRNFH